MPCIRGPDPGDRTHRGLARLYVHPYRPHNTITQPSTHRSTTVNTEKKEDLMTRIATRRSLMTLAMAASAAVPLGTAVTTTHAASTATAKAATSKTFTGSVHQMQQWGPIQVSIVVNTKTKKITKVNVVATAHTGRSVEIQDGAIPILKSETLQAQSANIDLVSRATDTSGAYVASLQTAVKKAKAAKALK